MPNKQFFPHTRYYHKAFHQTIWILICHITVDDVFLNWFFPFISLSGLLKAFSGIFLIKLFDVFWFFSFFSYDWTLQMQFYNFSHKFFQLTSMKSGFLRQNFCEKFPNFFFFRRNGALIKRNLKLCFWFEGEIFGK